MTNAAARARLLAIAGLLWASGLVHVAILLSLPRVVVHRAPLEMTAIALELRGAPTPEPQGSVQRDAPAVASEHVVPPSPPRGPRASAAPPADVTAPTAPAGPMPPAAVASEPATDAQSPAVPDQRIDIAPRAAALSSFAAATESVAGPRADDRVATRGDQLSADLKAIANANPARRPHTPVLVRDADGTCHYAGDAIDATILPDGGVRFEDKPPDVRAVSVHPLARGQLLPRGGAQVPPEHPVTPEEQLADQRMEVRIRVGGRAWKAERDWFLRETEAVRAELADAAHARELAAADHELRKRLDRIWCNAAVPPAARRRALFGVWDEVSSDEVGARGRRVVLQYMRENLPKGSAQAFPREELARLNLGRPRGDRFEPYAAEPR